MQRRSFIAAAAVLSSALAALPAQAQTKWDLPSPYPAFNFHSENIAQFAKDVESATGGQLRITPHPGASLFKGPEIKRALQGGQVQAGEFLLVGHQNEWPLFGADGLPFLATSYEQAQQLYQAQKPLLEKKLGEQGMVLLYAVPWPPQGLFSKKPIESAAELKGMKMRAYSPATSRIAELVGAQPVTIQEAELSQALATGAVETLMTSGSTGTDKKLYESMKYYYDVQAWLPKNIVVANARAFKGLDAAAQEAVKKAAAAAEERGWARSKEVTQQSLDKLKQEGMQVLEPSAQLKADLAKVGETMQAEWLKSAGADGQTLLDAYKKGQ
ncbi:TRAP transporter substrate-binding protein [Vandammella animalimorsus]|uniref:C4-dicarboxylate ABC transporter substrate-binding protein n=1 Tax=Vandammella animalimorsus TaxID=2029117 RepID=A0A2A2AIG9_9BURK|nr:TRAP transporter substrate-binding protein [Vandammella animalimorsus]PAT37399.1 C4-dicarboxylate ABC transporter substrate-binding protein [Vandammella animalimorsus]